MPFTNLIKTRKVKPELLPSIFEALTEDRVFQGWLLCDAFSFDEKDNEIHELLNNEDFVNWFNTYTGNLLNLYVLDDLFDDSKQDINSFIKVPSTGNLSEKTRKIADKLEISVEKLPCIALFCPHETQFGKSRVLVIDEIINESGITATFKSVISSLKDAAIQVLGKNMTTAFVNGDYKTILEIKRVMELNKIIDNEKAIDLIDLAERKLIENNLIKNEKKFKIDLLALFKSIKDILKW